MKSMICNMQSLIMPDCNDAELQYSHKQLNRLKLNSFVNILINTSFLRVVCIKYFSIFNLIKELVLQ